MVVGETLWMTKSFGYKCKDRKNGVLHTLFLIRMVGKFIKRKKWWDIYIYIYIYIYFKTVFKIYILVLK